MFLGDSTKLPALVLAGGTSEGFFDVGSCCYFILTRRFYISGLLSLPTGTSPWLFRPVKASTISELCSGYFRLLYFCQAFPSHFYRERYAFERAFFTYRRFLKCVSSPHFGTFCDSDAGTPHPGSSSVPALTDLSFPADAWPRTTPIVVTRPLVCQN